MAVYFGLAALIVFLYVGGLLACELGACKHRVDQVNNALIALAVFLLFALRSTSVGVDVDNYIARFSTGRALENRKMGLEVGYAALNEAVSLFTSDPHVFLGVVAALTITPVAWVIGRSSEGIYLSWILFMTVGPFAFMLSGLRQGIALAVVFASLPFLARRKILIPLLLVAVAVTFHSSALVFLPAIYLYRVRLTPRAVLTTVMALFVAALFGDKLLAFAITNLYGTYEVVATGAYRWALVNAALWLALVPLYRSLSVRLPSCTGLYVLVLSGVVLLTLARLGTNVSRGAIYYLQFFAILAPNALSVVKDSRAGILLSGTLGVMALTYFFLTAGQTAYEIVPYMFKWEG